MADDINKKVQEALAKQKTMQDAGEILKKARDSQQYTIGSTTRTGKKIVAILIGFILAISYYFKLI